jgi:uncharacterized membrane protein (UPF0127 family)
MHPLPFSRRLRTACAGLLMALAAGFAAAQTEPQPKLATVPLAAGMHAITAEVARTDDQRQMGLMLRRQMAPHEGMLFVFDDLAVHCFWMKNTLLPLSIAFLADDGRIVDIVDMTPKSEASNCPSRPVRYALEMNKGWFAQRAIKPGFRLTGEPFRP